MSDILDQAINYVVVEPSELGVASVVQSVNISLQEDSELSVGLASDVITSVVVEDTVHTVQVSEGSVYIPLAKLVDMASDEIIYKGEAAAGSLTSDSVWRIARITIAEDLVKVEWSHGKAYFDNVWDDRHLLNYA